MRVFFFKMDFFKIFYRQWIFFKKDVFTYLLFLFFSPLFVWTVYGWGLGSFMTQIEDLAYLEFIFPSILFFYAFFVPFFEQKSFENLWSQGRLFESAPCMAGISERNVLVGILFWKTSLSMLSVVFLLLFSIWTHLHLSGHLMILLLLSFFISLVGSVLSVAIRSVLENLSMYNKFILWVLLPLFSLSGAFFPLNFGGLGIRILGWASPMGNGIYLMRKIAFFEGLQIEDAVQILILCAYLLLGFAFLWKKIISIQKKAHI